VRWEYDGRHEILGEGFGGLDACSSAHGPNTASPAFSQRITQAGFQCSLRPDDDQIDLLLAGKGCI
jgi:hypothetical protein